MIFLRHADGQGQCTNERPGNGIRYKQSYERSYECSEARHRSDHRVERRRRWSWDQKRAIVEESLSADASAAAVARRHGIGTGQLYTWRHQLLRRQLAGTPRFACVDVEVAAGSPRLTGPIADPAGGRTSVIEIALADGNSDVVTGLVSALRPLLRSNFQAVRVFLEGLEIGNHPALRRLHRRHEAKAYGQSGRDRHEPALAHIA